MNSPLPTALTGLALVGASFATTLGQHIDGVIRVVTLFTLTGTIIAYRRYQCDAGFDPFPIITRWSATGLIFGIALELVLGLSWAA